MFCDLSAIQKKSHQEYPKVFSLKYLLVRPYSSWKFGVIAKETLECSSNDMRNFVALKTAPVIRFLSLKLSAPEISAEVPVQISIKLFQQIEYAFERALNVLLICKRAFLNV